MKAATRDQTEVTMTRTRKVSKCQIAVCSTCGVIWDRVRPDLFFSLGNKRWLHGHHGTITLYTED